LTTDEVPTDLAAVQNFILRAFWSLEPSDRIFAASFWQSCPTVDIPGCSSVILTDEELVSLALLQYSSGEGRFSSRTRPLLAPGKCPSFKAFLPVCN